MREKILLNERYCAVEIDKSGLITGYNNSGLIILSGISKSNDPKSLKGISVLEITGHSESSSYDSSTPEFCFSQIKEIKIIDTIYYSDTESSIVRFAPLNSVFSSFFDIVKFSFSSYLEFDKDMNIIFASDSFCKTTGKSKPEIYGSNISLFCDKNSFIKIVSASDLCRNEVLDSFKIEEMQFTFNEIPQIYTVDIFPVKDSEKMFAGIFCHFMDTSLERKCKKMDRAIRRMSAVANFAGGIAHDYNNALTAVLGNISLAKMDAEKGSELEELLKDAESAGLKIKILTERLGMFSRGMKPSKVKTDIKELIEDIIPDVFKDFKGQCEVTIQDSMIHPEIDPELISEAVIHVMENAVDAADINGAKVAIDVKEIEIDKESVFRETSLVNGKYILISVEDNGAGINLNTVSDIFDPYITTKPGREGLGLALTYTILKRHRGFISAGSSGKGGAEFKIYIPLF